MGLGLGLGLGLGIGVRVRVRVRAGSRARVRARGDLLLLRRLPASEGVVAGDERGGHAWVELEVGVRGGGGVGFALGLEFGWG